MDKTRGTQIEPVSTLMKALNINQRHVSEINGMKPSLAHPHIHKETLHSTLFATP